MKIAVDYTTGAGNTALYVRQRNFEGKYANLSTLAWDTAESANTKAFLIEPDATNAPGFYSTTILPISGNGWPLEVVEAATGKVLYKGGTESGTPGEYTIAITMDVAGSAPVTPIPDVTAILRNATDTLTLQILHTDSLGKATFPVSNGTYILRSMKAGYTFTDQTVTVAGADVLQTAQGTQVTGTAVAIPGMQILMVYAKEIGNGLAVGDKVKITPVSGQEVGDYVLSTKELEATIGASGIAEIAGEVGIPVTIGARINVTIGNGYYTKTLTVDSTAIKNITGYL